MNSKHWCYRKKNTSDCLSLSGALQLSCPVLHFSVYQGSFLYEVYFWKGGVSHICLLQHILPLSRSVVNARQVFFVLCEHTAAKHEHCLKGPVSPK
jgi:hypothetical protein